MSKLVLERIPISYGYTGCIADTIIDFRERLYDRPEWRALLGQLGDFIVDIRNSPNNYSLFVSIWLELDGRIGDL